MEFNMNSSADLERAILAGIIQHGADSYYDVADLLQEETFTIDSHRVIFRCLENVFKHEQDPDIDVPLIIDSAKEIGYKHFFNDPAEQKLLKALREFPVSEKNVRTFSAKIRKLHIARLLYQQLENAQTDLAKVSGSESITHILGIAEDSIFNLSSLLTDDNEPEFLYEGIDDYLKDLMENPVDQIGISTGFEEFDAAIGGGLRPGTLNVIAARSKAGKTTLTSKIGHHIGKTLKIPVLNMDTEMQKVDHINKTLAMLSGVPINIVETGKFVENKIQKENVLTASENIKSSLVQHKSIAGMPFEEQIALMRRWIVKNVGTNDDGTAKQCVVIYDYLKIMDSKEVSKDLKEFQVLGFMMTTLHNFAVRYKIPVIITLQLNRDGIEKETQATASGSDRIVWLCSNYSIFKQKSDEEIANDGPELGNRKLVVVAARHGPGHKGHDYINFKANLECSQIFEISSVGKNKTSKIENQDFEIDDEPISFDSNE